VAAYNALPNIQAALVASTVDTITLPTPAASQYEIVNVDGTGRIDYTLDGSTPVAGGSTGTYTGRALAGIAGAKDVVNTKPEGGGQIKLISAGTPHYSVQAVAGPTT
jgi:hypothetical protein